MIKTVLFDLDGTLLPMDMDEFVKAYFKLLAGRLTRRGYDPKQIIDIVWAGTYAMMRNDGRASNEEVYWSKYVELLNEDAIADKAVFDDFYVNEFNGAQAVCGYNPEAGHAVKAVRAMGLRAVLATNPVFPLCAVESRLRWAGVDAKDFDWITSYENIGFSKPHPGYYRTLLRDIGAEPEECLMVGNDTTDDLPAEQVGMRVFLLTDCLINKNGVEIDRYPHGSFPQLLEYLQSQA